MRFASLTVCVLLSSLSLVSCQSSLKGYTPAYLIADTPLDAPGVGASRKIERDKRSKEGLYKVGDVRPVVGGKAMLFMSNPDYDKHIKPAGQLVDATSATVIFCEGLYYFVETNEMDRGYIRESDLAVVAPTLTDEALVGSEGLISVPTDYTIGDYTTLPGGDSEGLFPGGALLLDGTNVDSSTATTESGRVVNIKTRDTGKAEDFEKVREKLEQSAQSKPTAPTPPPVDYSDIPDLPEPSGSFD